MSDNGSQYQSQEFAKFAREWGFEHVTSSLHYLHSNGKAENAVKTTKMLLRKAKLDGSNPLKAILEWHNTLTEGLRSSPMQRLISCRTKTLLLTCNSLLVPDILQRKIMLFYQSTKGNSMTIFRHPLYAAERAKCWTAAWMQNLEFGCV